MKPRSKGQFSPNAAELVSIYAEIFRKPNVRLCYIGKKTKRDPKTKEGILTGEIAIVCGVNGKIPKKELHPSQVIPSHYPWLKNSSRPRRIKTDVMEFSGKFEFQTGPIFGTGDKVIRLTPPSEGTIGIAINHPEYGPVITTAGHVFKEPVIGEEVDVVSGSAKAKGSLQKCVRSERADYALIKIKGDNSIGNLFRDMYPLCHLHFPSTDDLHKELAILTTNKIVEVRCEGINGLLKYDEGEPPLANLILTTCRTEAGDSGACLVGDGNKIWGLLVGAAPTGKNVFSAFLPAYIPVGAENAELI